jgi:alpha-tubulin suppressor-like RCC1 family protein
MAKKYQLSGAKPSEASWIPGLTSEANIHYRTLKPELRYFESVVDIASGFDHILLLTSQGRVFSAAASSSFPVRGQTGIPGLTYATRPKDKPYDTCHEITGLNGHRITKIAAGDYHSLVRDNKGQVLSFGENTNGQLGFDYDTENDIVPTPRPLPLKSQYPGTNLTVTVKTLAAGGANSYFVVNVEDIQKAKVTSDLLACGTGIFGNLGNGKWTHVQGSPIKVKSLSGLSEYDERVNKVIPIRPKYLSVGATHTSAIMNNLTKVDASSSPNSPVYDVNYGADVLWWGSNEYYQLGTGKRANSCVPVYIPPLDPVPEDMAPDKASGMTGSSTQGDLRRKSGIIGGKGDDVGGGMSTRKDQVHRFQITPRKKANISGRAVEFEQRISCGQGNTAVYSAV